MTKATPGARKDGDSFTGYVKRGDAIIWSRGGYDSKGEALAAAKKQAKAMKHFV